MRHKKKIVGALLALLVAIALVIVASQNSQAATQPKPVTKAQPAGKAGWTTVRTATGYVTYSPKVNVLPRDRIFQIVPMTTTTPCWVAETCLSVGSSHETGYFHLVVPPGGYCPCVYEPIWYRTFTACNSYWAYAVSLCMNGELRYANGYAACTTACSSSQYRGRHSCHTYGTQTAGFSISDLLCSDTYLSHRSPVARGTTVRYEAETCFIKYGVCEVNVFHLNTYPSGTITGPYGGEGAYE